MIGKVSAQYLNLAHNRITDAPAIKGLFDELLDTSKETGNHSRRVNALAQRFGATLSLTAQEIIDIQYGAMLHDIGKLKISNTILHAPRRLSDEETEEMQRHPVIGADIARQSGFSGSIIEIITSHHEYWDGQGYPHGLTQSNIPFLARVVSIIDAYDTMTSKRSYKNSRPVALAVEEIERCGGTQFDPDLATVFTEMIRESLVRRRRTLRVVD